MYFNAILLCKPTEKFPQWENTLLHKVKDLGIYSITAIKPATRSKNGIFVTWAVTTA